MKRTLSMNRSIIAVVTITLSFAAGALGGESSNGTVGLSAQSSGPSVQTKDSQPFTHLAQIAADSDKGTIKFQSAKIVDVPTRVTYTMNQRYCEELSFRDPGGSLYCPYTQTSESVTAYELTYSYIGQPLPSDGYADRKFTFQVYFRPDELPPQVRRDFTAKKPNRTDFAEYFKVSTVQEPARRIVIDETRSHLCDGNFLDGAWTHTDANCNYEIYTKVVATPSDYITVRVDPVSAVVGLAEGLCSDSDCR